MDLPVLHLENDGGLDGFCRSLKTMVNQYIAKRAAECPEWSRLFSDDYNTRGGGAGDRTFLLQPVKARRDAGRV